MVYEGGHGIGVSSGDVLGWASQERVRQVESLSRHAEYRRKMRTGVIPLFFALILSLVFWPAIPAVIVGGVMYAYYWVRSIREVRAAHYHGLEYEKWVRIHEVW